MRSLICEVAFLRNSVACSPTKDLLIRPLSWLTSWLFRRTLYESLSGLPLPRYFFVCCFLSSSCWAARSAMNIIAMFEVGFLVTRR